MASEATVFLSDLLVRYNTDDKCREYLEELRWPKGPKCPKCESTDITRISTRQSVLRCKSCQQQFTVTVDTIFHDSHLPLTKWFVAVLLMCEAKKGMSALQMKRTLGMAYQTAWYLCMRIRQAMATANGEKPKLSGIVEMDETYVGGKMKGGKRGRGSENKQIVIGIRQRGGQLRLFKASDVSAETLSQYIKENVDDDEVEVMFTDELKSYPSAMRKAGIAEHEAVNHSAGEYVSGNVHTNTVESAFSLFKRGLIGSWHKISVKHLQRYLEEMSYRFDERGNPQLFSMTLKNLLSTDPLTFKSLTDAA
ncbi:MAG: IS1595 family transposase [Acidobacteria bacterium]|nr:MAG: IS1595 family transposase [Acidobacteriota bacterium]